MMYLTHAKSLLYYLIYRYITKIDFSQPLIEYFYVTFQGLSKVPFHFLNEKVEMHSHKIIC